MNDERITRYYGAPPMTVLKDAFSHVDDDVLIKVAAVLNGDLLPSEASPATEKWIRACYHTPKVTGHEAKLMACDELLGGHGVESIRDEDFDQYTDEGIRMCPPFSYVNMGDTYIATLARDHENGQWMVACWGDLCEEYERDHEKNDYETFDECPERCPDCHGRKLTLEFFPGSSRGPSYSWVCDSCNHHCLAVEGYEPPKEEDEQEDAT